jgi:nitrogen fixation protein FixH
MKLLNLSKQIRIGVNMTQDTKKKQPKPYSGKRILYYFIAFFLVIIVVNVIFIKSALNSHTGVITKNAYEKGLEYNKTIQTVDAQTHLGWHTDFKIDNHHAALRLFGKYQKPINHAKITLFIKDITSDKHDFSVPLTFVKDGLYQNVINFSRKGQWDIRIAILWEHQSLQIHKQVTIH